ncbi:hypothetical protein TNCV_4346181 [Trichonephila clavipes]|nr:hypothetical protein TNCV_4346181 [Trichonephila clavipes]
MVTRRGRHLSWNQLSQLPHHTNGRTFELSIDLTCIELLCTVGLQWYQARNHDTPATSPLSWRIPLGYHGHQVNH